MQKLTAIIISFMRPRYAADCVRSLRETYPDIEIIVGEQQKTGFPNQYLYNACLDNNAKYIPLDWDLGVGTSRNALIKEVKTKYTLIGDDDFLYDKEAGVDSLLKIVKGKEFDLAGGRIREDGRVKNFQGRIHLFNDHIKISMMHENEATEKYKGIRYAPADLVFNYFVADTQVLKDNPWDENIKVSFEHSHYFINLKKTGVSIAFVPDSIVKHKYQKYPIDKEYLEYRNRRSDKHYFFESLGINYIINARGGKMSKLKKDPLGDKKYRVKAPIEYQGRRYNPGDLVIIKDYDKLNKGIKLKIKKA